MDTHAFTQWISFTSPWPWLVAGAMVLLALWAIKRLWPRRKAQYKAQMYLFTKTEWHFAMTLQEACGSRWLMMGKVRIADLLSVKRDPRLEKGAWMRAFSKISQKHIDYVLVNPNNGRVVCCIELDDPSHQRLDRRQRDVFVNAAFDQADMPLLRVPTRRHYDANALRHQISAIAKEQKRTPGKVERGLENTETLRKKGKKKKR